MIGKIFIGQQTVGILLQLFLIFFSHDIILYFDTKVNLFPVKNQAQAKKCTERMIPLKHILGPDNDFFDKNFPYATAFS